MFKHTYPYPHTYSDDLIEENLLREIKKNWPDKIGSKWDQGEDVKIFRFESNESWLELDSQKRKFWRKFIATKIKEIIKKKYSVYENFITKKFKKKLTEVFMPAMGLTEFGKNPIIITDGVPHCHFNEGVWLFTILIHVEDKIPQNSNYNRGNTMFAMSNEWKEKNNKDKAIELSKYKSARPSMKLFDESTQTIPFKEGRVYSFLETCLSYHGFDNATRENSRDNNGRRKMIRVHVSAPEDCVKELYQLDKLNFRSLVDDNFMNENLIKFYEDDLNRINDFKVNTQNSYDDQSLIIKGIHNHEVSPYWTKDTKSFLRRVRDYILN